MEKHAFLIIAHKLDFTLSSILFRIHVGSNLYYSR